MHSQLRDACFHCKRAHCILATHANSDRNVGGAQCKAAVMAVHFGRNMISVSVVFLQTQLSYAFVNRKPIVPGHVLVSSKRVVPRFSGLTPQEVSDLFTSVHRIAPGVEKVYNVTSLTIAIQDGRDAGQTVEHVHVHIIPRRPGDFQRNDDIYEELQRHDKEGESAEEKKFRSLQEMEEEAKLLASHFQ